MNGRIFSGEWREKLPPICPHCGYNLTGAPTPRCPECGNGIRWDLVRQNAKSLYYRMHQVENAKDVLNVGVYLGLAGLAIVMLFWLLKWGDPIGRTIGVFLSIATFGCGIQVFRVRRFPDWAREYITVEPSYMKGAAVAVLGVAVFALVAFLP